MHDLPLWSPGQTVFAQWWGRDPAAFGDGVAGSALSNALAFVLWP